MVPFNSPSVSPKRHFLQQRPHPNRAMAEEVTDGRNPLTCRKLATLVLAAQWVKAFLKEKECEYARRDSNP
jgi:hypothetical protein